MKLTGPKIFSAIVTSVVIILIIIALVLVGSPTNERLRRFDEQRTQELQQIRFSALETFYHENGRLPESLDAARAATPIPGETFLDPVTQEPYEYTRVSTSTYKLCAVFDMPSRDEVAKIDPFWTHDAGRTCFNINALSRSESDIRFAPFPVEKY